MALVNRTTKTAMTPPYMRAEFWLDKNNHYWETDMYTEESKNTLRKWVESKLRNRNEAARRK
tara:strand:- start:143 stop:328 length:186 start_codon:yes stop_codon:yes gene_type:complete